MAHLTPASYVNYLINSSPDHLIRLYSDQGLKAWEVAERKGYWAGPTEFEIDDPDDSWRDSYNWMRRQMAERLPEYSGDPPITICAGVEMSTEDKLDDETWLPIKQCPNYEVSQYGQIRRSGSGKSTHIGKIIAQKVNEKGYLSVQLQVGEKTKQFRVNRLVCEAFNGPPPTEKHQAAHIDGVRSHNHFKNLSWKTATENSDDKYTHGTMQQGERAGSARLTEKQVLEIRDLLKKGALNKDLAKRFAVSENQISSIKLLKRWKHI